MLHRLKLVTWLNGSHAIHYLDQIYEQTSSANEVEMRTVPLIMPDKPWLVLPDADGCTCAVIDCRPSMRRRFRASSPLLALVRAAWSRFLSCRHVR